MPIARYQLPDGRIARFDVPDGTSPEQAQQIGVDFFAQQQPDQPAQQPIAQQAPTVAQSATVGQQEPSLLERGVALGGEFAAGANRALLGLGDIALSPINVGLQAAGQERIPPLAGFAGQPGDIAGPGLPTEIASSAGELAAGGLGAGTALRAGARLLAPQVAGESAGLGVARQLGGSGARADISGGALSGVGAEVGEEVGGETGKAIGGLAAPLAPSIAAIPLTTAKSAASTLLKKSAPSIEELKTAARGIYKSLDESGVSISRVKFNSLVDDISSTLQKEGIDRDLTPKATALVNRLRLEVGTDKNLTEIDTLRKVAQGASTSNEPAERRLGALAIEKIDNFLDDIGDDVISAAGDKKQVGQAFRSARDLWQRARKAEVLDQAVVDAQSQASGLENGLRTQFRQIAKKINRGKLRGFTAEETRSIEKVNKGTAVGNIAKLFGKFGILDGVTSRSLTTLGGIGIVGGATSNPVAAAAVPLIGQMSGALAQRMTASNAAMASAIIRAGRNGGQITNIYLKNTLKGERSANELAELYLAGRVPVLNINTKTAKPIVSDAAIIAAMANINDKKGEQ